MITALMYLIQSNVRSSIRYLKSQAVGKVITVFMALLLVVCVEFILYRLGKNGLEFIQGYHLYKDAFTLYVFELYMAVILYLSVFSSVLVILFTLLKSGNEDWIIATPRYQIVPYYYIFKITISTLIPILLLALPLIIAMKTVLGLSFLHVFILVLGVVLFIMISILFAMILVFAIASILLALGKHSAKLVTLLDIITILIVIFTASAYFGWKQAIPSNYIEFWQIPETQIEEFNVDKVNDRFISFPSHKTAQLLYFTGKDDVKTSLSLLVKNAALFGSLFFLAGILLRWFLPIWQKLMEGSFEARTKAGISHSLSPKNFPVISNSTIGALFEKEFFVHARGLKDVIWSLFILSLWLFYTGINVLLRSAMNRYGIQSEEIFDFVYALQIAVGMYFITAFVLRFVLPAFSTEAKTSWIIGSAPIKLKQVMVSKLLFFTIVFIVFGILISIFNFSTFEPAKIEMVVYLLIFSSTIITTTFLGLFLGFVFPNFSSEDPEVLGTSVPGLLFTFSGILYGAVGGFIYYLHLQNGGILLVFAYLLLSMLLFGVMMLTSPKYLKKLEFAESDFIA